LGTIYIYGNLDFPDKRLGEFRNLGIEEENQEIKIDRIHSIPKFLNPLIPQSDPGPIFMQSHDR
jgi:hypothetical protein